MRIAIDAAFLQTPTLADVFIEEIFLRLAEQHPNVSFFFLVDNANVRFINLPVNIALHVVTPHRTNFINHKWWYDVKLPLALKKLSANIFIGTGGACSLATSIPQILVIQSLSSTKLQTAFFKGRLSFHKTYTFRFLQKATAIVSFSDYVKKHIATTPRVSDKKISVINIAANTLLPMDWEEREQIKEKYTMGCEYFISPGKNVSDENLTNLLKAFSIFKKWQKSNMKLVIVISSSSGKYGLEKLSSYKYKNEVVIVENVSGKEFEKIIAGAYAMIFTSTNEEFAGPILQAMQGEIPVIISAESSAAEIICDAALYANPSNPANVADQMRLIFKDEQLRTKMVATARERAAQFSWDKTTSRLFQLCEQLVSK